MESMSPEDTQNDLAHYIASRPKLPIALNAVSVLLISIGTTGAACVAYAILRNRSLLGTNHNSKQSFPIRERMLLGLFVTHVWAGPIFFVPHFVYLVSSSFSLSGRACHALRIAGSTGATTAHLWTVCLAIVTYVALTRPLSTFLVWAEHAWFGIGLAIYAVATGVSFGLWWIGSSQYEFGYCAFGGISSRYSELTNLIPRIAVLTIILTIYLRLHIFLRHRRRDVHKSQHTVSSEIESGQPSEFVKEFDTSPRQSCSTDETPVALTLSQTTACDQPAFEGSDTDEQLQENIMDFINRKARMLILLFPLSYTILVVVSLAKLSYNVTHPGRESLVLNVVGRWALYLQSSLDALTYGWAGARLKRAVHKLEEQRAGT